MPHQSICQILAPRFSHLWNSPRGTWTLPLEATAHHQPRVGIRSISTKNHDLSLGANSYSSSFTLGCKQPQRELKVAAGWSQQNQKTPDSTLRRASPRKSKGANRPHCSRPIKCYQDQRLKKPRASHPQHTGYLTLITSKKISTHKWTRHLLRFSVSLTSYFLNIKPTNYRNLLSNDVLGGTAQLLQ